MNTPQKTLTTSDGVHLRYTDEGSGSRTVVLLHGLLCHGGHWAFQSDALLAAGYRVIALDLRSHGASDHPEHGQRVSRHGQDLAELIDHEHLSAVSLVGHSMGVSVALAYLSLHGTGAVSKLIAIDQAPRIINDSTWQWGVRHVRWEELEDQIEGRLPWGEPEREPAPPAHVIDLLNQTGGIEDFLASPLALRIDHFTSDWRDVLPLIDVPAWIVTSQHSPSFPLEGMEWVAATIPDANLTVYPNSGHCPHWNEFEDFNRDMLAFLAR